LHIDNQSENVFSASQKTLLMKRITYRILFVLLVAICVTADFSGYAGVAVSRVRTEQVARTQEKVVGDQPTASAGTGVDDDNWTPEQKGKMDADKYYKGWRAAKTATVVVTALFGGILGLIPALATSLTPPKLYNLDYPDEALMRDPRYKAAYEMQAKKIKSRKVWGGFGLGVVLAIALFLLLSGA
jgi:hypothetical protein